MKAHIPKNPERIVRIIPANPDLQPFASSKRQENTCAYARVSTEAEEQQNSYEVQIEYYKKKIMSNKNWKFVDIYADEGISGTQMKNRKEFKRMLEDCRKGKIDIILTKSISRFARNTVDSISVIRELKALGIAVIFEKENINTMNIDSETFITLQSCMAQAESESISKNVTWGVRRHFAQGSVRYNYRNWYGYRKGADGQPEIVPEEAEIVKEIFAQYLSGRSTYQIAEELNARGIPKRNCEKGWLGSTIRLILLNERYCGDAISQKTYTVDCLTHRTAKNRGELPKYYLENVHPGIVDRATHKRVQEENARRGRKQKVDPKNNIVTKSKYCGKYALTELLYCSECGTAYRRLVGHLRNGVRKVYWRCGNRVEHGTKYCPRTTGLEESILQDAIMHEIQKFASERNLLVETLKHNFEQAILEAHGAETLVSVEAKIEEIRGLYNELLESSLELNDPDANEDKFRLLTEELESLQAKAISLRTMNEGLMREIQESEMKEIMAVLDNIPMEVKSFDNDLARMTIKGIEVFDKGEMEITFKDGSKARTVCE